MNFAQWFMLTQVLTCLGGGFGFYKMGMPFTGLVWVMYSIANVGWFMIASGYR